MWPRSTDGAETSAAACAPMRSIPEHAKALWAKSEEMVGERF